jgi:3-hydroxymyristoyl/3-hydroxydecanoyl-(acyl carrier protein) dehydratase
MRFLLVDRILGATETGGLRGLKTVAMSEDVLEHHFPGRPILPGSLMLEAMAQLAGWHEAIASGFERWWLLDRVERCAFYGFVLPGDRLELEVEPQPAVTAGRCGFRGVGTVDGERRVAATFEGRTLPLAELDDPQARRRLYARLARESDG